MAGLTDRTKRGKVHIDLVNNDEGKVISGMTVNQDSCLGLFIDYTVEKVFLGTWYYFHVAGVNLAPSDALMTCCFDLFVANRCHYPTSHAPYQQACKDYLELIQWQEFDRHKGSSNFLDKEDPR